MDLCVCVCVLIFLGCMFCVFGYIHDFTTKLYLKGPISCQLLERWGEKVASLQPTDLLNHSHLQ